jgi:hypothetical protein
MSLHRPHFFRPKKWISFVSVLRANWEFQVKASEVVSLSRWRERGCPRRNTVPHSPLHGPFVSAALLTAQCGNVSGERPPPVPLSLGRTSHGGEK